MPAFTREITNTRNSVEEIPEELGGWDGAECNPGTWEVNSKDSQIEAGLGYKTSSRTAWSMQQGPVLKQNNKILTIFYNPLNVLENFKRAVSWTDDPSYWQKEDVFPMEQHSAHRTTSQQETEGKPKTWSQSNLTHTSSSPGLSLLSGELKEFLRQHCTPTMGKPLC